MNEKTNDISNSELEDEFIGGSVTYYKKAFENIRNGKLIMNPVWVVLVFGPGWLLYRKMVVPFIIYNLITSFIYAVWVWAYSDVTIHVYDPILMYLLQFIVLSFLAKHIYYHTFCMFNNRVFSRCKTKHELMLALKKYGGTIMKTYPDSK